MDVTIKILPIVREEDGVAMSSRNTYLSKPERKDASLLYKSLEAAREAVNSGERDAKKVIKKMREMITASPSAKTDYISIVDVKSLKEIPKIKGEILIALAVFIGKKRLIDNVILDMEELEKIHAGRPKEVPRPKEAPHTTKKVQGHAGRPKEVPHTTKKVQGHAGQK